MSAECRVRKTGKLYRVCYPDGRPISSIKPVRWGEVAYELASEYVLSLEADDGFIGNPTDTAKHLHIDVKYINGIMESRQPDPDGWHKVRGRRVRYV